MKITKKQLKRIIKEEKIRLLSEENSGGLGRHPDVQEGLWRGVYEGIWHWLEDEAIAGPVDMSDPAVKESWANSLETIAKELRQGEF
jgi:hypothetical protein